ncbi:MAG: 3-dehydroquinate synthase [Burkholderiales bacterium]|nr:3-dehydroquinate synthase [Burkholderiales bacterium]
MTTPMSHDAPNRTTLHVSLGQRSYPILIGGSLLSDPAIVVGHLSAPRVALVTNEKLYPLYGEALSGLLRRSGIQVLPICLPDGEQFKDWPALNQIFDALLEHACDRKTTLIALGGGVIGDITGFAAATYQRGVPFIQIPTTLLAQVDSSVGGKTAINHTRGKNMIGAFYQPLLVLADTDTLKSLPAREYRSGLAEVIKYGLALDAQFFDWLEANIDALNVRNPTALAYAIKRSCEIKAQVVAEDERETAKDGGRALLNLGHTFGHAVETALGYGVWLHGEAVGCGMVLAAQMSNQLGMLEASSLSRATELIKAAGLPIAMPSIATDVMLEYMGRDKKNEGGNIRLILPTEIGKSIVDATVSRARIGAFLDAAPAV